MIMINTFPGRMTALVSQRAGNAKLRAALSSVEYVDQTLGGLDDLKRQAPEISFDTSIEQVSRDVYDLVATGQGLPEDVVDRYHQALTVEQVRDTVTRQLNDVASNLVGTLDQLIEGGLNAVCGWLHADLQRICAGLREVRTVPADAVEAINAGKAEQWQAKALLLAEYAEIRDAQRSILTYGWSKLADEGFRTLSNAWPIVGHARGLGAVWTDLPEWHKYGRTQNKDGRMVRLTPPWPDPASAGFVDWLVKNPEAQPWVPTLDQALELLGQITSRAQTFYENKRPDPELIAEERAARRFAFGLPTHVVGD